MLCNLHHSQELSLSSYHHGQRQVERQSAIIGTLSLECCHQSAADGELSTKCYQQNAADGMLLTERHSREAH